MMPLVYIAMGGGLGAVARYLLSQLVDQFHAGRVPWGTLSVNLIGSVIIGIVFVVISEKEMIHQDFKHLLVAGFLGAFTTYSTFSLDTFHLIEAGHYVLAGLYVICTSGICLLGVFAGIYFSRAWF